MCPFMTDFFHSACFQVSFMSYHVSVLHSFAWPSNIPLCGFICCCFFNLLYFIISLCFICSSAGGHLGHFHFFGCGHSRAGFTWTFVLSSLGCYTQEGDCRVVWKLCVPPEQPPNRRPERLPLRTPRGQRTRPSLVRVFPGNGPGGLLVTANHRRTWPRGCGACHSAAMCISSDC